MIKKRGAAILIQDDNVRGRHFWSALGYEDYPELIEAWRYFGSSAENDGGYTGKSRN